MAANESYVQGPPDSTGKKVDTTTVTNAAGDTVHREGAVVADPSDANARAKVTNAEPKPYDHGSVVRLAGQAEVAQSVDVQVAILTELRVISRLLQSGLNVRDDLEQMRKDVDVNDDPLN